MKKILFYFLLITSNCYAASDLYKGNEEIQEVLNSNVYEPNYFQMIFGLLIVLALIYITGIVYQKLAKVKISDEDISKYKANVISTTSLGQNKNLHVIKVMGEYILIGSTQNNITYIKDLYDEGRIKGSSYGKNG